MQGTDFMIKGVSESEVRGAKQMFLHFRQDEVLEETPYGLVLQRRKDEAARIYVRGLEVAKEENFLFSYNITHINTPLKRALNRERSNVGRAAYADRVKRILLTSTSQEVAAPLAESVSGFASGNLPDEVAWNEVAIQAVRIAQSHKKSIFVTTTDLQESVANVDHAVKDGYQVIQAPDRIIEKLGTVKLKQRNMFI